MSCVILHADSNDRFLKLVLHCGHLKKPGKTVSQAKIASSRIRRLKAKPIKVLESVHPNLLISIYKS